MLCLLPLWTAQKGLRSKQDFIYSKLFTPRDTALSVDAFRRRRGGMSPVVVVSGVAIATVLIFRFVFLVVLSKLPTARFRSGPRADEFLRRGVSAVVCSCFTDSGAERKGLRCQNGSRKVSKATKMKLSRQSHGRATLLPSSRCKHKSKN